MADAPEITSAIEILSILRQLIKHRELLTVSFNRGQGSMVTMLLDVDPDRGLLTFDASGDQALNEAIVAAGRLGFSGSLLGARVGFSTTGAKTITYRGGPALAIRMPTALMRAQHRAAFRVNASGASCTLAVPGHGRVTAPLTEVSVGGGQLVLNHSAADHFGIGQVIAGCQIDLGSAGKIVCDLEVRNIKHLPNRMVGMGCRMRGLSRAHESLLARFVAQQETKSAGRGLFGL